MFGIQARNAVISVETEPIVQVKCKCHRKKKHDVCALAFFKTKKEAVAYGWGNPDFQVVRGTFIFSENV